MAAVALAVRAAMAQGAEDPVVDDAGTDVEVVAPGGLVVLEETVVQGRREVNIQQATLGANHNELAPNLWLLGRIQQQLGDAAHAPDEHAPREQPAKRGIVDERDR